MGRVKVFENSGERLKAFRKKKKAEDLRKVEVFISPSASWRLAVLAKAWRVSKSGVVERLLLEADQRYRDIIFEDKGIQN